MRNSVTISAGLSPVSSGVTFGCLPGTGWLRWLPHISGGWCLVIMGHMCLGGWPRLLTLWLGSRKREREREREREKPQFPSALQASAHKVTYSQVLGIRMDLWICYLTCLLMSHWPKQVTWQDNSHSGRNYIWARYKEAWFTDGRDCIHLPQGELSSIL